MRRLLAVATAAVGALAVVPLGESARKPMFTVSIEGTQRFQWTLDATRNARGQTVPCGYKGNGQQVVTFHTPRPITVRVPEGRGTTYTYGGQPFLPVSSRGRLIPLTGEESREYQALQAPAPGACEGEFISAEERKYFTSCRGTNPFLPNAGVVVMRYRPTPRHRHKAMMYAPVDATLFPRRPATCDLRLFDLRNYLISQLMTIKYLPLSGGNFERRATTVVRAAGSQHGCVDPFGSDASRAALQSCGARTRPGQLTGELTANWTLTFRRVR
jgi:hypothetical protein